MNSSYVRVKTINNALCVVIREEHPYTVVNCGDNKPRIVYSSDCYKVKQCWRG